MLATKLLMEVDGNIFLIIGNLQGILDQQLIEASPFPQLQLIDYIKFYIIC
jgi:hypothetical protein